MNEPDHYSQTTEDLLHGLIAECADMVRTQLRPGLAAQNGCDVQWGYARAISDLVRIAARAGEAVARLRADGGVTRHHITVRHIPTLEG